MTVTSFQDLVQFGHISEKLGIVFRPEIWALRIGGLR